MAISLYEAIVPGFQQVLGGVAGFLERARAHFEAEGVDIADIVETRLFADMLPLKSQVLFTEVHSIGAIEAVKRGSFSPPRDRAPPADFPGLQKIVADAREKLAALRAEDVDGLQGRDMVFQIGDMKLPFTAEGFLFSFSQPNFHFHATTAYDILRMKGVPLGKRDYLGQMRFKT